MRDRTCPVPRMLVAAMVCASLVAACDTGGAAPSSAGTFRPPVPTPLPSPSVTPSARASLSAAGGTVTQTDRACAVEGAPASLDPGPVSLRLVNATPGNAAFDLFRLGAGGSMAALVDHVGEERRRAEAGEPFSGPPIWVEHVVGSGLVTAGAEASLVFQATDGTYALVCLRKYDASSDPVRPSSVAGPILVGKAGGGGAAERGPSARGYHGLVDIAGAAGVLLVGGSERPGPTGVAETWEFDAGRGWVDLRSEHSLPFGEAVAYHPPSGLVVAFLGSETWTFDPRRNAWTLRPHDDGPRDLLGPRLAYDAGSDRMILFGGDGSDATWAYDAAQDAWEAMRPAAPPPARNFHHLAYDAESDRVILFGGGTDAASFGDTWAYDYDLDAWTEMAPGTGPAKRSYGSMVYEPASDRMILFGGVDGPFLSEDAYGDTWAKLRPATAPSPRGWHAMAREADSDRIVLFGGGPLRQRYTAETWLYDPAANAWQEVR